MRVSKTLKAIRQSLDRVEAWGSRLVRSYACAMIRSRLEVVDGPGGAEDAAGGIAGASAAANPKEARERNLRRSTRSRIEQLPGRESIVLYCTRSSATRRRHPRAIQSRHRFYSLGQIRIPGSR